MCGAHSAMAIGDGGASTSMAKGYPVRPETSPQPECHECGSLRLSRERLGARKCLDCGATLVADPFAVP